MKRHDETDLPGEAEEEDKKQEKPSLSSFMDLLSQQQTEEILRLLIPVIKLNVKMYLIGTKSRHLQIKNTNLLVRVGGGFMDLDQYLTQYSKSECLKINMLMQKHEMTYREAVVQILKQHKAAEKVVNKFKRDSEIVPIHFTEVLTALKLREKRIWEERKSIASSTSQMSR